MHTTQLHHSTFIQSAHKPYLTTQIPLNTSSISQDKSLFCFELYSFKFLFLTHRLMFCFLLYNVIPVCVQDFPLLWLDDIVDEQSNIVGFSMFNTTHPFYLEFIRSLNLSWREGCDINPYPGPAVRLTQTQHTIQKPVDVSHTDCSH